MKILIVIAGLVLAEAAQLPVIPDYHKTIGIPKAKLIKDAESIQDFDGSRIFGGENSLLGAFPYMVIFIISFTSCKQLFVI